MSIRVLEEPTVDIEKIRQDFPILNRKINDKPIIYFDNAASTQKPKSVIDRIHEFYQIENSNIHRGNYTLSEIATENYEKVRNQIQKFLNAEHSHEIIFTRGTTESINLVAQSFSNAFINKDDEIIISELEHHSNIVPWQIVCEQKGAHLKVIPILESGDLDLSTYEKLFSSKTKIVSLTHISNAIGTVNPIKKMIEISHHHNVPVFIDGAQSAPHFEIDVQELDCDFFAFSGHKIYGPTGIGVLYGKEKWLDQMPPYQSGGEMINQVSFKKTTYHRLPFKFEAGTPHIAGVMGLGCALEYLNQNDRNKLLHYENELLDYTKDQFASINEIELVANPLHQTSLISFLVKGLHPSDVGTFLNEDGISVRAGHHCAMPLMELLKVPATVRASFSFYNTKEEIDIFINSLKKIIKLFGSAA